MPTFFVQLAASPWLIPIALSLVLVGVFPLLAGYLTLVERKVLADMQTRLGPMRVGAHGLLQPLADAVKLILKEDIVPRGADKLVFMAAPMVAAVAAMGGLGLIPFGPGIWVARVDAGLLVITATGAIGVLGIMLGGWSANSHYPLLGALRSAAQLISFEIALSLALLTVAADAGTLDLAAIVEFQVARHTWLIFDHFGLMLPVFAIYFVAAVAEANRAPFDLPEAESELVAGYHTEYSGMRFALFMLSEYGNLFVLSALGAVLFLGGWSMPMAQYLEPLWRWLPPVLALALAFGIASLESQSRGWNRLGMRSLAGAVVLASVLLAVPVLGPGLVPPFWLLCKIAALFYVFIWLRGTFPRLRYDQLMQLSWKWLIPWSLAILFANAAAGIALAQF